MMPFPRNSLRAFLSHAKSSLRSAIVQKQHITLVIGNESADLDSLTSSLLYAYIRSQSPPSGAFSPLYVPVVNIPKSDIALRPEFAALFQHTNLSSSNLITLDDLSPPSELEQHLPPNNTRWILVDHNRLQGALGETYSSRVHGTIDHHDDEGTVPHDTQPEPRQMEKCGSCTSLVVRYLRPSWDAISSSSLSSGGGHAQGDALIDDSAVGRLWDAQVAKLALASILVDTRDLQDRGETRDVDREAVAYLESRIKMSGKEGSTWDRGKFFEEIHGAKRDIDGLPLTDILRKDYKEWEENGCKLGMSSVVKALEFLAKKAGEEQSSEPQPAFDEAVGRFMTSRGLALFAIMTTSTTSDGQFQRQLLLQTTDGGVQAATRFEERSSKELGLERVPDIGIEEREGGECPWRRLWTQRNVAMSRKQVAPMLRKAIAGK